jgi:hypothetical protein
VILSGLRWSKEANQRSGLSHQSQHQQLALLVGTLAPTAPLDRCGERLAIVQIVRHHRQVTPQEPPAEPDCLVGLSGSEVDRQLQLLVDGSRLAAPLDPEHLQALRGNVSADRSDLREIENGRARSGDVVAGHINRFA